MCISDLCILGCKMTHTGYPHTGKHLCHKFYSSGVQLQSLEHQQPARKIQQLGFFLSQIFWYVYCQMNKEIKIPFRIMLIYLISWWFNNFFYPKSYIKFPISYKIQYAAPRRVKVHLAKYIPSKYCPKDLFFIQPYAHARYVVPVAVGHCSTGPVMTELLSPHPQYPYCAWYECKPLPRLHHADQTGDG